MPPYQGKTVGLSGWIITATLKGTDPAVYVTTTTDALGNYTFNQADLEAAGMAIPGATITVCEEKRDHWIPVSAACVDVHFPYPVPVDYKGAMVNFTNVQDPPSWRRASLGSVVTPPPAPRPTQVRAGDTLSGIAAAIRHLGQRAGAAQWPGQPQHDPGRPDAVHPVILPSATIRGMPTCAERAFDSIDSW